LEEQPFPVIELDFNLLSRVLTEYGHAYDHIDFTDEITVEDVNYDTETKVLTAFIKIIKETVH
jgi:hypothetical protein